MTASEIKIFDDPLAVAQGLTDDVVAVLENQNTIHFALSGGSTPQVLFKLWADQFATKIDWSKIHFWWSDERCVPPDDPESNFGVVQQLLFSRISIPESNIHRMRGESNPEAEAARYGEQLRQHLPIENGRPAFDIVMLGMGGDGHTASIFPHQMELLDAESDCAVAVHPDSGQRRITLTGPVLNNARLVAFLITGEGKREMTKTILNGHEDSRLYPTAWIKPVGQLNFYLDRAAAGNLT